MQLGIGVMFVFIFVSAGIGAFINSITSLMNGDQIVTIISAVIGVIGAMGTAVIGVVLTRGARNRR